MTGARRAPARPSFLKGPTGLDRARLEGLSGGVPDEPDDQHAARQAHGRARPSFSGALAVTALASQHDRQRAPRPRASFLEGRRRWLVAAGSGFWLAKGAEEFAPSGLDNATYTRSRYSSAALASDEPPGAGGRASRPHPSPASAAPGATSSSSRLRWRAHPRTQLS